MIKSFRAHWGLDEGARPAAAPAAGRAGWGCRARCAAGSLVPRAARCRRRNKRGSLLGGTLEEGDASERTSSCATLASSAGSARSIWNCRKERAISCSGSASCILQKQGRQYHVLSEQQRRRRRRQWHQIANATATAAAVAALHTAAPAAAPLAAGVWQQQVVLSEARHGMAQRRRPQRTAAG